MTNLPSTCWQPSASLATLRQRAQLLQATREYFIATGAMEVETPNLSTAGVTDIHLASVPAQACAHPAWLHTSPEYFMKRLLAAGSGDLWQICKVYRDGEQGRQHNPEFTLIEWYRLGLDHHQLMDDVEALVARLLPDVGARPTQRLSYGEAVQTFAGINPFEASQAMLIDCLEDHGIEVPASLHDERDACLDLLMGVLVGPQLGREQLTFIYDYPASQAALARIRGPVASRFEAYLHGMELANGFHELGNADEQRQRFVNDQNERQRRGLPPMPIDEHFIASLAHGLPDCAGVALGFDRLVMCATGAQHIEEVLSFDFARA